jgi:hypothetical protein
MQSSALESPKKQEDTQKPASKLAGILGKVLSIVEELDPAQRCHVLYAALGLTVWPLRRDHLELGLPKEF